MDSLVTNDGSFTLFNPEYKEAYHSRSGAIEEAFKKYVEPCKIKSGMRVLDICFGIGYNSGAVIHKILEENGDVEIIALEFDENVLKEIKNIKVPDSFKEAYSIVRKAAENEFNEKIKLKIVLGDARITVKNLKGKFDAIFLDPFSTMKNPELWTVDFFKLLKDRLDNNGILATYSSSAIVRNGLKEAGFKIGNGPIVGRARPSTLASIKQ